MLHCNMDSRRVMNSQWDLDDLLADLHHARRRADLGRLAFVAYCDVRRWARGAGREGLAEQASRIVTDSPHQSREEFLAQIDQLIASLEALQTAPVTPGHRHSDDQAAA
jgi:hypothetical protein